jgi:hypothetical protein
MRLLIKRLGILFVIIGVILLAVSEFSSMESNNMLIWSGGLIIGGLVVYLVINNIVE